MKETHERGDGSCYQQLTSGIHLCYFWHKLISTYIVLWYARTLEVQKPCRWQNTAHNICHIPYVFVCVTPHVFNEHYSFNRYNNIFISRNHSLSMIVLSYIDIYVDTDAKTAQHPANFHDTNIVMYLTLQHEFTSRLNSTNWMSVLRTAQCSQCIWKSLNFAYPGTLPFAPSPMMCWLVFCILYETIKSF